MTGSPTSTPVATGRPRVVTDLAEARRLLTRRRGFEEVSLSDRMREGIQRVFGADLTADEVVARILRDVRTEGDEAVRRYTQAFDGTAPDTFEVPQEEWQAALAAIVGIFKGWSRVSATAIAGETHTVHRAARNRRTIRPD